MNMKFFDENGHVAKWVFYYQTENSKEVMQTEIEAADLIKINMHLENCSYCKNLEIEAILNFAVENVVKESDLETQGLGSNTDIKDSPINVTQFDKFHSYLREHILENTKGQLISFFRDEDGMVTKITGKTNGNIESESVFIYDGATISVHSFCHNCQDNPLSDHDQITFTDFHIDFQNNRLVVYNSDSTEFYPEDKTINRQHRNHKIFYSASGKVVKILQNNNLLYLAEYNESLNLLKEKHGEIIKEFGYDGSNIILKKSTSDDGTIIDNFIYEYAEGSAIPFRSFKRIDNQIKLDTLNIEISSEEAEHRQLELVFDGIARNFYDESGSLVVKVRLPEDPSQSSILYSIANLKEKGGKFDSIDMVLVDNNAKSIRILKKIDGKRIVDQTAFYRNDQLTKVYNHKDAQYKAVLGSFFASRKWSDIIERDDNIL